MTTREEKRTQMLVALGLIAIGLVAFFLDDHEAASWKTLTVHQMVQLGTAAVGLLIFPLDMAPAAEKIELLGKVLPWLRSSPPKTNGEK